MTMPKLKSRILEDAMILDHYGLFLLVICVRHFVGDVIARGSRLPHPFLNLPEREWRNVRYWKVPGCLIFHSPTGSSSGDFRYQP